MDSRSDSDESEVPSGTDSDSEFVVKPKSGAKRVFSKARSKRVVPSYIESDSSDDCTSVSRVALDPMQVVLSVLSPSHRKMIEEIQREKDELESKVTKLETDLYLGKRKLEEQVAATQTMATKVQRLEIEAATTPVVSTGATGATAPTSPPPSGPLFQPSTVREPQVQEDDDDDHVELDVYARYTPLVAGGTPHPTALCSSTNLVDLLSTKIKSDLQSYLHATTATNGALSDAQLEAIALARRRNVVDKLAFADGDATGVGKTRIALGFVFNHQAFVDGTPRVLYVSVANLFEDVERDARAIGLRAPFVNGTTFSNKGKTDIVARSSNLFVSHSVLHSFSAPRLLKWLLATKQAATPGNEPILIVDEIHKSANASKRGAAAAALLDGAHTAGVHILVLSATFAANVPQLKLTAKITGMIRSSVHPEHPVAEFTDLARTLRRLGEAGLETLSMQLRTSGGYVSRSLSMAGVEFELVEAAMCVVDEERYVQCATIWKDLFAIPGLWTQSNSALGVFHSASLRFFKTLTMLIKLPHVVQTAIAALERGGSVILTCLSTDEASISRSTDAEDDDEAAVQLVDGAESESRLRNGALLDTLLQVVAFARKCARGGDSTTDALDRIEARGRALDLPAVGALDIAMHRIAMSLGNDRSKIVELTGRSKSVQCAFGADVANKSNWKLVTRSETLLAGKQRFQQGSARVAMLSAAASTGVSLHDLNGSRRTLVSMELPYSSVQFVQTVGRAHRSGQKSAPAIVLVTLPSVKAETRFAASICARLLQLGAISNGDRRSGAGCVDFGDALGLIGAMANRAAVTVAGKNDIPLGSTPTSIKLMNRCLAMAPSDGNAVMDEFQAAVSSLSSTATNQNTRIKTIEVDGIVIKEICSFKRVLPAGIVGESFVHEYKVDKGLTFDQAMGMCDASTETIVGLFTKRQHDSAPYSPIVVGVLKPCDGGYAARLTRPNGNKTVMDKPTFERIYMRVDATDESARTTWDKWYDKSTRDGTRFKIFAILTLPVIDFISSSYIPSVKLIRCNDGNATHLGMLIPTWARKKLDPEKPTSVANPWSVGPSEAQSVAGSSADTH